MAAPVHAPAHLVHRRRALRGSPLHLHHRAAAARTPHQRLVRSRHAALAGNAITGIVPAGDVAGAAVQFRMLATAGIDPDVAVGGLTAFSLLGVGGLLALPIFALPAIVFGGPVNRGLLQAALLGVGGFCLFAGFGAVVLVTNRPLSWSVASFSAFEPLVPESPSAGGPGRSTDSSRDAIRKFWASTWPRRYSCLQADYAFDFFCLLAALPRPGATPALARPPGLRRLRNRRPGPDHTGRTRRRRGELQRLLILANVNSGDAFLATLTYRLASYWLPLLAGPVAYLLFRHRYSQPN